MDYYYLALLTIVQFIIFLNMYSKIQYFCIFYIIWKFVFKNCFLELHCNYYIIFTNISIMASNYIPDAICNGRFASQCCTRHLKEHLDHNAERFNFLYHNLPSKDEIDKKMREIELKQKALKHESEAQILEIADMESKLKHQQEIHERIEFLETEIHRITIACLTHKQQKLQSELDTLAEKLEHPQC